MSLVEVMVAMGVFVVTSLSLLSVLTSSMAGTFDNRSRVTAAQLAASDLDLARAQAALDYYGLAGDTYTEVVDGRTYTVSRSVASKLSDGAPSSCVGSSARQLYKRVSTTVSTARGRANGTPDDGLLDVRADTLVKAPVYDAANTRGAIGLVVIDRAGAPLQGLTADVSGTTRTTDAKGCAFFDGLVVGTRTVTVARAGSVTIAGSASLSRQVSVSAGQITSQVLQIDTSVNLTVVSARCCDTPGPKFIRPNGLSAVLSSPDRTSATRVDYPAQAVVTGDLVWPAYPNPAGYEAYLGPCQTAKHTPSEPGPAPAKVQLPLSTVTVQLSGGNASSHYARGQTVRAVWRGTETCSETLTWPTTATDPTCKANANSATEGCFVHLAVPAGPWRFEIAAYPAYFTDATMTDPATSATVKIQVPL